MKTTTESLAGARYLRPDAFTKRIMNPIVAGLARAGLSIRGSQVLEVRGRVTGEVRTVPVNPMQLGDNRYLVAPRGNTQWVRNLRVAGEGRLKKGRTVHEFKAVEVANEDKVAILRAYLDAWAFEVGKFFEGIDKFSSDAELHKVASGFPVFLITAS